MCSVPPPLPRKYLRIWCGVPTLVEHLTRCSKFECAVSPPKNSQTSCQFSWQSSSTCILKCGTPSWACYWCFLCVLLLWLNLLLPILLYIILIFNWSPGAPRWYFWVSVVGGAGQSHVRVKPNFSWDWVGVLTIACLCKIWLNCSDNIV